MILTLFLLGLQDGRDDAYWQEVGHGLTFLTVNERIAYATGRRIGRALNRRAV